MFIPIVDEMPEQPDKREAILRATLKLIVDHGLEATPMSLIGKEAGVGMGTIYHYFASKEVLVNVLYRDLKQQVYDAMLRGYPHDAPYRERFFRLWRSLFDYYLRHPYAFLFMEQVGFSPILTEETRAVGYRTWEAPIQLFEQAQAAQVIKNLPLSLLGFIAGAPLNMLVRGHLANQITLTDELIEAAITACWDSIKL